MAKEEKKNKNKNKNKNKDKKGKEKGKTSGLSMSAGETYGEAPKAEKRKSNAVYFEELGLYKMKVLTLFKKPHYDTKVQTVGFTARVVETSADGVKKGTVLSRVITCGNNFGLAESFQLINILAQLKAEKEGIECDEKYVAKFQKKMEKLNMIDDSSGFDRKYSKVGKGLIFGVEVTAGKEIPNKPGQFYTEVDYGIMPK